MALQITQTTRDTSDQTLYEIKSVVEGRDHGYKIIDLKTGAVYDSDSVLVSKAHYDGKDISEYFGESAEYYEPAADDSIASEAS
jgi:hypothetical protein